MPMRPARKETQWIRALYVKKEELFTTKNSPPVYQDSDNRKAVRNFLRHRNGEFHVNREVIRPCPITDALAFQLANARAYKDVVDRYLRHASAGGPGGQVRKAQEISLVGKCLRHA